MDRFEQALNTSIEYIGKRLRTEHEVKEMLGKDHDNDIILRVINRLKELSLLNDDNYVSCYVRDRSKLNPAGRMKIKLELINRGLPLGIISENEEYTRLDELKLINAIIKKKKNKYNPESPADRKKLASYLYRRGFEPYNIRTAMRVYDTEAD